MTVVYPERFKKLLGTKDRRQMPGGHGRWFRRDRPPCLSEVSVVVLIVTILQKDRHGGLSLRASFGGSCRGRRYATRPVRGIWAACMSDIYVRHTHQLAIQPKRDFFNNPSPVGEPSLINQVLCSWLPALLCVIMPPFSNHAKIRKKNQIMIGPPHERRAFDQERENRDAHGHL